MQYCNHSESIIYRTLHIRWRAAAVWVAVRTGLLDGIS